MEIDIKKVDEELDSKSATIARNVKSLRNSCGITQQDLAVGVHMDKSRISDIENVRAKNLTLYSLTKLSLFFDVKICDLLREW